MLVKFPWIMLLHQEIKIRGGGGARWWSGCARDVLDRWWIEATSRGELHAIVLDFHLSPDD